MVFTNELENEIDRFQKRFDGIIAKMENSMNSVIKEHDQEVVFACLTHLIKAKEDAITLKWMLESQLQANEEYRNFEKNAKELDFFRKEVLRLTKKLDSKEKEIKELNKTNGEITDENKFLKSQVEFLFAKLRKKDIKEYYLASTVNLQEENINVLEEKDQKINQLQKELNNLKLEMNTISNNENIYQKLFMNCVEEVNGKLNAKNKLKDIGFKFLSLDKIKILESFFKNEEIVNLVQALMIGNPQKKNIEIMGNSKAFRELKRLTILPKRKSMLKGSTIGTRNNLSIMNMDSLRDKSRLNTSFTRIEDSFSKANRKLRIKAKLNSSHNMT